MIEAFIEGMRSLLVDDERVLYCQFRGDPNSEQRGKWRARVLNYPDQLDPRANVYVCVSAMRPNVRGEYRRRKENFGGGVLLMIDDLGDGPGSKFPLSTVDAAPPTGLIETSPGNYQAVYLFRELVTDMRLFEALISAFIEKEFLGKDTGMAGVNRVFRPPFGINGKPKYGGDFEVRAEYFHPERRYTPEELATAFELNLRREGPRAPRLPPEGREEAVKSFVPIRRAFSDAGMVKSRRPDLGDWFDVRCPWTEEHTAAADNGAALRMPAEENRYYGAFRCHHGACAGRGLAEVKEWLDNEVAELLDFINEGASDDVRDYL